MRLSRVGGMNGFRCTAPFSGYARDFSCRAGAPWRSPDVERGSWRRRSLTFMSGLCVRSVVRHSDHRFGARRDNGTGSRASGVCLRLRSGVSLVTRSELVPEGWLEPGRHIASERSFNQRGHADMISVPGERRP